MIDFEKLTPKKFRFKANEYDKIFMMFKNNISNKEIADEFNMAAAQISIVLSQIVTYIASNKEKYEAIKAVEKVKNEIECSYKDLMFPIDNEPTIGNSKVISGKIYSDGILWK